MRRAKSSPQSFAYFATSGGGSSNSNGGADIQGYDDIPYDTGSSSGAKPIIDLHTVGNLGLPPGGDIS